MFAYRSRHGSDPQTAARQAGARLGRLAAVLAAVTAALLAWAAAVPAAFASDTPPGLYGRFPGPVSPATGHAATAGGIAGWQIALITAIALAAAAAVAVLLDRMLAARRATPTRTASSARPAHTRHSPAPTGR